jgi:hypothetical protein
MYRSFIMRILRNQQLNYLHSCYCVKHLDPGLLPISFNYESRLVPCALCLVPCGVIFFLYTNLTSIGLCPLGRSVISQVLFFLIAFISSSFVAFHFRSRTAFILYHLADIPGPPHRLSHRDFEDSEILSFLVQPQFHMSFSSSRRSNWVSHLDFLN